MSTAAAFQSDRITITFDGTASPVKTAVDPPDSRIQTTDGSLVLCSPSTPERWLRIETSPPASVRVYDLQVDGKPAIAEGFGALSLDLTARAPSEDRTFEVRMTFPGNSALVPHTQVLYVKKPYPKGITPVSPGTGPGMT